MEGDLTGQIIDIFKSKLGWTIYYFDSNNDIVNGNSDGQLQVNTDHGCVHLVCEIKKSVVPSSIAAIRQTIDETNTTALKAQGTILLSNYISTKARELLIENKINYADTGGNIFLKHEDIHIHIETGQSDRSALSKEGGRAFTKTGLKVIHQFFRTNQNLNQLNKSYQELADEAKVSKDTVSKVMLDLLDKGYVLRKSKTEFKWRAKKELFERWVQEYNQTLKPSLVKARFKFLEKPTIGFLNKKDYQVSGYQAVDVHYKIPIEISKQIINPGHILYTHKSLKDAIKDFKLIPSDDGEIIIYKAFWQTENFIAVDHIISYADLIDTNDPRMMEVAQILYQNYFHDKL